MLTASGLLLLLAVGIIVWIYGVFYRPNVLDGQSRHIYLYEEDDFDSLLQQLKDKNLLRDERSFKKAADYYDYPRQMHSGHYVLEAGMNNKRALQILRLGLQQPVRIRFHNLRKVEQLAGLLSKQVMADSLSLLEIFYDRVWLDSLGLTAETLPALFIPDTYEVWWNSSPEKLMQLFSRSYRQFWNEERRAKAEALGLSPVEVSVLASIIEEESNVKDEWPVIAGLYLNRLRRGMYLQACPTVKFALNDFSIQRVLTEHTEVVSPYNTYLHLGLPPGPIRIPQKSSLLAVLDAEKHNYLYMCAKDDFSGRHYFSSSLAEHNRYAQKYHRALNQRRILK
ncbi:MAG: putative aminodeoxychorismate lyase [Bacteroidetes bacterium ADurb.Bin041]|nr:MAG: putative aminodeoxychorismate lyase [Bacteroidetes bacterium ADurb.Bin041]